VRVGNYAGVNLKQWRTLYEILGGGRLVPKTQENFKILIPEMALIQHSETHFVKN
jgi:hypothetical protein